MQPPTRSALDRVLSLVGDDDPDTLDGKATAFRRFLLLALAVEAIESRYYWVEQPHHELHVARIVLMVVLGAIGWFDRWARPAVLGMFGLMVIEAVSAFPDAANHHYLQMLLLVLFGLLWTDVAAERELLLKSVRWLALIGLFYAGLQKMLHGYYFNGSFLAYAIGETARFSDFFSLLVSDAEVARLQALDFGEGAGPYLVDSPLFVAASNFAYLGELIPVALLLFPRTRAVGLWALIAYIVAIELGARELFFGALMLSMLLLFTRDWNRRLLPWLAAAYLYLAAMSLELLPRWYFT